MKTKPLPFSFASRDLTRWLLRKSFPGYTTLKSLVPTIWLLLAFGLSAAGAGSEGAASYVKAPDGATVITIPLKVIESLAGRSQGYLTQRSPERATELASLPATINDAYAGKEFVAFDLGKMPDGTRYLVVFNEDKTLKFLSRFEPRTWYARIYRLGPEEGAKPEVVNEGLQSGGGDVTLPIEIETAGIGTTKVKNFRTEIGYSFSGHDGAKPMIYTGRGPGVQVAGSDIRPEGKLTLTVTVPEEMKPTGDTPVSLRFEPVTVGLPERVASGKITEYLTLGAARFMVTGITPDFSQATLALVSGSLEETLKQQLQRGAQMPPFSQVDLVTRKSVTREEVLGRAKRGAAVLFIFGDLPTPRNPYGPAFPPGQPTTLPLPPAELAEQVELDLQPKPVVVFVTRQIGIDFLYGDLRNKTPEYLVLTDYADPLKTSFRLPQTGPGGYYGPSYPVSREPALRQLFNLPERTLAVAVFDANGKVVYVKADAGTDLLPTLAEAREACKRK